MTNVLYTGTIREADTESWELEPGWEIEATADGFSLQGSGHTWARLRRGQEWSDYALRCRLKLTTGGVHVCFRVSGEGRYFVEVREDELSIHRERPWGTITELDRVSGQQELGTWHDLEVVGDGPHVSLYVNGTAKLDVHDEDGLDGGSIAFETLKDSTAAVTDVSVVQLPDPGVRQLVVAPLEADAPDGWELREGARVEPERPVPVLRLQDEGIAAWGNLDVSQYSLSFQYHVRRGGGEVWLQSDGVRDDQGVYRLGFEGDTVGLDLYSGGDSRRLGEATVRFAPDLWVDVDVHSLDEEFRLTIDGEEVFHLHDVPPLESGGVAFSTGPGQEVVVANVRVSPWSPDQVADVQRRLAAGVSPRPEDFEPVRPVEGPTGLPEATIPLEVQTYGDERRPHEINPGPVPPNFVHTWVIDLKDVEAFRFHFAERAVNLDAGDTIDVYSVDGLAADPPQALHSIAGDATQAETVVDLAGVETGRGSRGSDYVRVFVELTTSDSRTDREFVVDGIEITSGDSDTASAVVLGDDLNYTASRIAETELASGVHKKIPEFWSELPVRGPPWPRPRVQHGWYQVAQYLADDGQGFFTLAYYNERESRVRLYLYNYGLTDATVYGVRLSLLGHPDRDDRYEELDGAFFPLDPDPSEWGSVTLPVEDWPRETWICLEVPLLYPMAEKLPTATPPDVGEWYEPLYERRLREGVRNVAFHIEVQSYLRGSLEADLVGKAVGTALQRLDRGGGPGAMEIAKSVWTAMKTGNDWRKDAKKVHEAVDDFYQKHKDDEWGPSLAPLRALTALGAGPWGWALAGAGATFSLLSEYLFDRGTAPLQLLVELKLRGRIEGTISIPYQSRTCSFYLPGRCSIVEAVGEGLAVTDPAEVESFLPRYERSLGLFGFRYDPATIEFPMTRVDLYLQGSGYSGHHTQHTDFVYPGSKPQDADYPFVEQFDRHGHGAVASLRLGRTLPVVHNPYAEIVPMTPVINDTIEYTDPYGKSIHVPKEKAAWLFDVAWPTHVDPAPGDTTFPHTDVSQSGNGPRMTVGVFLKGNWGWTRDTLQVQPEPVLVPPRVDRFQSEEPVDLRVYDWSMRDCGPWEYQFGVARPLENVILYWDVPYFYYGQSRQRNDGSVPRSRERASFFSPVSIDLTRLKTTYHFDTHTMTGYTVNDLVGSDLLNDG